MFEFVDNCISRLVGGPLKYLNFVEVQTSQSISKAPLSSLLMVVAEQWPFFVASHDQEKIIVLAKWISGYLRFATSVGENAEILEVVRRDIQMKASDEEVRSSLEWSLDSINTARGLDLEPSTNVEGDQLPEAEEPQLSRSLVAVKQRSVMLDQALKVPEEPAAYLALNSWQKKDIAEAVEDKDIGNLITYLGSSHEEIRRQAMLQIRNLMHKLKVSVSSGH